jgi:hypothetical protein
MDTVALWFPGVTFVELMDSVRVVGAVVLLRAEVSHPLAAVPYVMDAETPEREPSPPLEMVMVAGAGTEDPCSTLKEILDWLRTILAGTTTLVVPPPSHPANPPRSGTRRRLEMSMAPRKVVKEPILPYRQRRIPTS